jgi:hypothetical protein
MCIKVLGWDFWEHKKNKFQDGRKMLRDAAASGGGLQRALEQAAEKERKKKREKRNKAKKNAKKKSKKDEKEAEPQEKVNIEATTSFERWLNQENLMTKTMLEKKNEAARLKAEEEKRRLVEAEAAANADNNNDN